MKKNKIISLVFLGIVGFSCMVFYVRSKPVDSKNISEQLQEVLMSAKEEGDTFGFADEFFWWDTKSDESITFTTPSLYLSSRCSAETPYEYKNKISKVLPLIEARMFQLGLKKDTTNSSTSTDDVSFYDYVAAYTNEHLMCTVTFNPDCSSFSGGDNFSQTISVSCVTREEYSSQEQRQLPYLRDLGLKNTALGVPRFSSDGNFFIANISGRRGGAYVVAKKINGVWKEVGGGQDLLNCSTIRENSIPKDIVSTCYDEVHKKEALVQ
jgi:hypothetical protein